MKLGMDIMPSEVTSLFLLYFTPLETLAPLSCAATDHVEICNAC